MLVKYISRILAALVAILASLSVGAVAQAAPGVTECSGTIADERITGDVVVAVGESCNLVGTTVTGDVKLGEFGQLDVSDRSRVDGSINALNPIGVRVEDSEIGGDYRGVWEPTDGQGPSSDKSFSAANSTFGGSVVVRYTTEEDFRHASIWKTSIAGDLDVTGANGLSLLRSAVVGSLTVADFTSYVCGFDGVWITRSTIQGDASFSNLLLENNCLDGGAFDISPSGSRGDGQPNRFGGNVDISDVSILQSSEWIDRPNFSGNIVRGDLSGQRIDPEPYVERNRVAGKTSGQFAR